MEIVIGIEILRYGILKAVKNENTGGREYQADNQSNADGGGDQNA